MSREWKPGDVAAWDLSGVTEVIFRCMPAPTYAEEVWQTVDGGEGFPKPDEIRPLVVIDPEDREQVERLLSLLADALNWGPHNIQRESYREPMQAALRDFANPKPPKPEEPTGLGAVVEDEGGVRWVRFESVTGFWWKDSRGKNLRFADLDVTRVLSEGVQP